MNRTRVRRYRGGLAGTLLLAALGLLYADPRLFAAAVVPLGYVAVGALSSLSGASAPTVERTFDPSRPAPGETVEVTLSVRNEGESALADLRVIDGVPDELAVASGSPRAAVALRPGESTTLSYSVTALPGDYEFDDPAVRVRTVSATDRATLTVATGGESTLSCARSVGPPPLSRATPRRVGTRRTDAGGEGVEFHSTREYRPGDSLSRVDWRRFAKTGDLTTVAFREERSARAVLVVDARPAARARPSAGYPNGAALAAYAAERLHDALLGAGVATGVTALGVTDRDVPDALPDEGLPWADSDGVGSARLVFEAVARAADRDATADVPVDGTEGSFDAGSGDPASATDGATGATDDPASATDATAASADGGRSGDSSAADDETVRRLLTRLSADAQVVIVSPVLDDWPASLARSLTARGHDVAVLAPDATGGARTGSETPRRPTGQKRADSPGRRVAATRRAVRLRDLRTAGATVVDWDVDDPLDLALERSLTTILDP